MCLISSLAICTGFENCDGIFSFKKNYTEWKEKEGIKLGEKALLRKSEALLSQHVAHRL